MIQNSANKLALGTAQFGLDYGIANASGQIDRSEASRILDRAKSVGISTLDTASAYGESENLLGDIETGEFHIVTKLGANAISADNPRDTLTNSFKSSLQRLNRRSVYGLLLHDVSLLSSAKGMEIYRGLLDLKQNGLVEKIGWSVYAPKDLDATPGGMSADLVQLPFNIFDQRMKNSGWLSKLKEDDVEIHARSIFLQGLLLMSPQNRPDWTQKWQQELKAWDEYLHTNKQSALDTCIRFSQQTEEIDKLVVGIDSLSQLDQIISIDPHINDATFQFQNTISEDLIDPRLWN